MRRLYFLCRSVYDSTLLLFDGDNIIGLSVFTDMATARPLLYMTSFRKCEGRKLFTKTALFVVRFIGYVSFSLRDVTLYDNNKLCSLLCHFQNYCTLKYRWPKSRAPYDLLRID